MARLIEPGKNVLYPLTAIKIDLVVVDFVAKTRFKMWFRNVDDRVGEGYLYFPLPENATVTDFGLDVDGEMRYGVVVGKDQGRVVYESEKRVDFGAGLAEAVSGNVFRTRIYPIPPNGKRIVEIEYVKDLTLRDDFFVYVWDVNEKDIEFSFDAVISANTVPEVKGFLEHSIGYLPSENVYRIEYNTRGNIAGRFHLSIPKDKRGYEVIAAEDDENVFLLVNDYTLSRETDNIIPLPRYDNILVLWDSSKSNENTDLKFIEKIFKTMDPVNVVIIPFSDDLHLDKIERINTFYSSISQYMRFQYDGATSFTRVFDSLQTFILSSEEVFDTIFMFSEGMSLYDLIENINLEKLPPVNTFSFTGRGQNRNLLQNISLKTGGNLYRIDRSNYYQCITLILNAMNSPLRVISSQMNQSQPSLIPSATRNIELGRDFFFLTKIRKSDYDRSTIEIECTFSKSNGTFFKKSYIISPEEIRSKYSDLLKKSYAIHKLEFIADDSHALERIGRKYNIVTPVTSFLVLETIEQHLKYNIPPHETLNEGKMLELFWKVRNLNNERICEEKNSKLFLILDYWDSKITWWNDETYEDHVPHFIPYSAHTKPQFRQTLKENFLDGLINYQDCSSSLSSYSSDRSALDVSQNRFDILTGENSMAYGSSNLFSTVFVENIQGREQSQSIPAEPDSRPVFLKKNSTLDCLLLLDVTPLSLGIEGEGGEMIRVINRNTAIPCKKKESVMCLFSEDIFQLCIYEGERVMVQHCNLLGTITISRPAYNPCWVELLVYFEIDVNGVLIVTVEIPSTGDTSTMIITNEAQRLTSSQIEYMIIDAEMHRGELDDLVLSKLDCYINLYEHIPLYQDFVSRISDIRYRFTKKEWGIEGKALAFLSYLESMSQDEVLHQIIFSARKSLLWEANTTKSKRYLIQRPKKVYPNVKIFGDRGSLRYFYRTHYFSFLKSVKSLPKYYTQFSDLLYEKGYYALSNRILSNIGLLDFENPQLLRIMAFYSEERNQYRQAICIYEKILSIRPEEPQSYRDLALALVKAESAENYRRAIQLLTQILEKSWDKRFFQIENIVLMDLNNISAKAQRYEHLKYDQQGILENSNNQYHTEDTIEEYLKDHNKLGKLLDVDVRVVTSWDTDLIDVDMIITEPNDEICNCFRNLTPNRGILSKDMTNGYGPEEYLCKTTLSGEYKIELKLGKPRTNILFDQVTTRTTIWTNFGRENESVKTIISHLNNENDYIEIASIFID